MKSLFRFHIPARQAVRWYFEPILVLIRFLSRSPDPNGWSSKVTCRIHGDMEHVRGVSVNELVQSATRVVAAFGPTLVEKLPAHGAISNPDRLRRARELAERVRRSSLP